jgi:division protein CdvB (Snf7/Vps24/ESCRT-III family)
MASSTKVMEKTNADMNVAEISTMIKDFQKQGMMIEMKQDQIEMVSDLTGD